MSICKSSIMDGYFIRPSTSLSFVVQTQFCTWKLSIVKELFFVKSHIPCVVLLCYFLSPILAVVGYSTFMFTFIPVHEDKAYFLFLRGWMY